MRKRPLVHQLHKPHRLKRAVQVDIDLPRGVRHPRNKLSRVTGYAKVIRRPDTGSIGGFRPARRDVVQKSASGKLGLVLTTLVPR